MDEVELATCKFFECQRYCAGRPPLINRTLPARLSHAFGSVQSLLSDRFLEGIRIVFGTFVASMWY